MDNLLLLCPAACPAATGAPPCSLSHPNPATCTAHPADGGGQGNLIGAVAEAAFMTGMERNSGGGGAVLAGAYAPLMVNANARPWPTNMLVFDNHRWGGVDQEPGGSTRPGFRRPGGRRAGCCPRQGQGTLQHAPRSCYHRLGLGACWAAGCLASPASTCSSCCPATWAPSLWARRWRAGARTGWRPAPHARARCAMR